MLISLYKYKSQLIFYYRVANNLQCLVDVEQKLLAGGNFTELILW